MKKTLCLSLAALILLSACASTAEEQRTSSPLPSETAPEKTASQIPLQTSSGPPVRTDWSALEPYEPPELLYRRWYEEPVRELIALEGGYGTLVPYVGSAPPDLSWGGVYEYGLMTMDGTIVVDTVYSDVYRLILDEAGARTRLPTLALMTTEPYLNEEGWTRGKQRFGASALDGSWSIPTQYDGIRPYSSEGFFLWDEDTVYVYHTDGQFVRSIPYEKTYLLDEFFGGAYLNEGVAANLEVATLRLLDLETGESVYMGGVSEILWPGDGLFPVQMADSGLWGCVDRTGTWVIPPRYENTVWPFGDGSGWSWFYAGGEERFLDQDGNEYAEDTRPQSTPAQTEEPDMWVTPIEDSYTGELWCLRSLYPEGGWGYLIEDAQGNVLGNSTVDSADRCIVNGLFLNIDGETAGYKDREGNWVFRIPLAEAGD